MDYVISLDSLAVNENCLVGEDKGKSFKKILLNNNIDLPDIEKRYDVIFVRIPEQIVTVTDSFIRGLFGERIKILGREFLDKYRIVASDHVCRKVEAIVTRNLYFSE